ncbi:MAG TPA: rod shape-determining protein MreD [Candidatus Acidoferrales bacterium]|nr:rod shape-determining protein MreD [Candidatus Acidoferrales bacterium]
MASMLNSGFHSDSNVEVHKFYAGTVILSAILALALEAFFYKFGRWSEMLDLPLLVTIYFGVSRRNPSSGLLLGAFIGLLQDALSSDNPIGMYGIAKTLVGFVASSVGGKIDTEHPVSRFGLVFFLFYFHQAVLASVQIMLLSRQGTFFSGHLLLASIVNSAVAVALFALLDRLRKP